jgi:periplasmic copper chaperone A
MTVLSPSRPLRIGVLATVLAAGAVALATVPASAHVSVDADVTSAGAEHAVLTFRVPNEDASAGTVKVAISFPTRTPLSSVRPAAKAGWAITTTRAKLDPPVTTEDGTLDEAVSQVVFTARTPADAIGPDTYDTFSIQVGPLPKQPGTLAFPTIQTYSSGRSVSWIEPVTDPANEPEHPAPTVQVTAPGAEAGPGLAQPAAPAVPSAEQASSASDPTARTLGVAGLVLGGLGLAAGLGALLRGRRPAPTEAATGEPAPDAPATAGPATDAAAAAEAATDGAAEEVSADR